MKIRALIGAFFLFSLSFGVQAQYGSTYGTVNGDPLWLNHYDGTTTGTIGGKNVWPNRLGNSTTGTIGGEDVWIMEW